jgi:hypothetical protein
LNDCCGGLVAGVTNSIPDDNGVVANIERCDACQRFPGDLHAALAVQEVVGGRIFFFPAGDTEDDEPEDGDVVAIMPGDNIDGLMIASGTDPWIVGARSMGEILAFTVGRLSRLSRELAGP